MQRFSTALGMKTATLLLGALTLCAAVARADGFDPYRVACSGPQKATMTRAIATAQRMLSAAITSLPPVNSGGGAKFQRWFGGPEGDYDPKLKTMYTDLTAYLPINQFWCPNATFPSDDPRTVAFVPKGQFGEIFVRAPFFDLDDSGADTKAGTIVHELSHQSTTNPTGDFAYGTDDAEQLARTDPGRARRCADNVEFYAEDVDHGIP